MVESHAHLLNCWVLTIPFVYLDMHTGTNPRKEYIWSPIMQKFSKKLALWKHKFISLGYRVCLLNFVLSSLSLFSCLSSKIPKVVRRKLMEIQRKFLWGEDWKIKNNMG